MSPIRSALSLVSRLGFVAALCCGLATAAEPAVRYHFAPDTGELRISAGDRDLTVARDVAQKGKDYPVQVWFREPALQVPIFGVDDRLPEIKAAFEKLRAPADQEVREAAFDPAERRLVHTYRWGEIVYDYEVVGEHLELAITVRNASAKSIWKLDFSLLYFGLSKESLPAPVTEAYFGTPARAYQAIATFEPVVLPLLDADRAIVACSPEVEKPLTLRWLPPTWYREYRQAVRHRDPVAQELAEAHQQTMAAKGIDADANVFWRLLLTVGGDQLVTHERYTTRTIGPGETDTFRVSLRFGAAARPLAPARDIFAAFAQKYPLDLAWPDRRIILRSFIGDHFPHHFPSGPQPVKPEVEPSAEFRQEVLNAADAIVADAKAVDAQGMVLWNVEGPNVRWLGYVGEPRMVEYLCPEMDAVADEFFGKLRAAGLRTGVCLRPTRITTRPLPPEWKGFKEKHNTDTDWIYTAEYPREGSAAVDLLSAKVQYAQKRWGCTLFYIDTNMMRRGPTKEEEAGWPKWQRGKRQGQFINYRTLMNAEQWRELRRRHPDCLFIPEHGGSQYYRATAPYDQVDMNAVPTPAVIRATWPEAFKCLAVDSRVVQQSYPRLVEIFRHRDVLMVNPGAQRYAGLLRDAKDEAAITLEPFPAALAELDHAGLLAVALDPEHPRAERFAAARRALAICPAAARAETLRALLDSSDSLLRRVALQSIGQAADVALLGLLGDLWAAEFERRENTLRGMIEAAVGRIGEPAIAALVPPATKPQPGLAEPAPPTFLAETQAEHYFLAEALAAIGTPQAQTALETLLARETAKPQPNRPFQRYAARTLKNLKKRR